MIFHTLREWAFPWFRRHVSARSERLIYCNGAAIEWTVKHISGANNCCYLNRDEEVFVHLDRDGISYHPWLLLMLMAGAFALQGEAIPSEICSMLASIYIKIENTSADDAFILTLGTKHFFFVCSFHHWRGSKLGPTVWWNPAGFHHRRGVKK